MKIFIELRDVNYPGSTYTLTYDPASDQLKAIYYQAVEKQRFPVAFVRLKWSGKSRDRRLFQIHCAR